MMTLFMIRIITKMLQVESKGKKEKGFLGNFDPTFLWIQTATWWQFYCDQIDTLFMVLFSTMSGFGNKLWTMAVLIALFSKNKQTNIIGTFQQGGTFDQQAANLNNFNGTLQQTPHNYFHPYYFYVTPYDFLKAFPTKVLFNVTIFSFKVTIIRNPVSSTTIAL